MTTPQTHNERDLVTANYEAAVREADARLKVLEAQAEARKAKADMDEISGLAAARERAKKNITDLKQKAAADRAAAKQNLEKDIKELQAGIQRVDERFAALDEAEERHFFARLDEADARLEVWKARYAQEWIRDEIQIHDDLARLKEKIALARARAAERRRERHNAKAQAAFLDAARHFDEAYDAAAKRYGR